MYVRASWLLALFVSFIILLVHKRQRESSVADSHGLALQSVTAVKFEAPQADATWCFFSSVDVRTHEGYAYGAGDKEYMINNQVTIARFGLGKTYKWKLLSKVYVVIDWYTWK